MNLKKLSKSKLWYTWKRIYLWLNIFSLIVLGMIVAVEVYALRHGYYIFPFYSDCCNSMKPVFENGDLCLAGIKNVGSSSYFMGDDSEKHKADVFPDDTNIKIGDIIMFRYFSRGETTHRVVGYCPENIYPYAGVSTKGDNAEKDGVCVPWWAISSKVLWIKCL